MALLYGNTATLRDRNGNAISFEDFKESLNAGIYTYNLNTAGIYDIIKGSRFQEYYGVYYPSQAIEDAPGDIEGEEINENAQTTSELKMRVISYYQY